MLNVTLKCISFFVATLDMPPIIWERMPRFQYAAEGRNLTLRCEVEGSPRPSVTWSKDGEDIFFDSTDDHSIVLLVRCFD